MSIWIDTQVCVMALFAAAIYFGFQFFGPLQRKPAAGTDMKGDR